MCGKSISTDRVPLVKASNCILVLTDTGQVASEQPCIRCGECAEACPVQLLPQQLFWYACADNEAKLRSHGLMDCIECGCCDLVCPSHIPLTADFRMAKARMQELEDEIARAERSRERYVAHTERLEKEQIMREQQLEAQKEAAKSAGPDAIREILKRRQQDDGQDDSNED